MSSSSGHEIVTLQVGGYSNWVGTHLWNLDKAAERQGEDWSEALYSSVASGSPPEPRLLAFDLRGRRGSLFHSPEVGHDIVVPWSGAVETHETGELHPTNPWAAQRAAQRAARESDESEEGRDRGEAHFFADDDFLDSAFGERAKALLQGYASEKEGDDGEEEEGDGEEGRGKEGMAEEAPEEDTSKSMEAMLPVESVTVWSDFLELNLAPSSYLEVPFFEPKVFGNFCAGDMGRSDECVLSADFQDEAFDRLRLRLEVVPTTRHLDPARRAAVA